MPPTTPRPLPGRDRRRATIPAPARTLSAASLLAAVLALTFSLTAQIGTNSDSWAAPVELRMPNPYFRVNPPPDDEDYFAPIHAILGPAGDVMLIGFRQADKQIPSQTHRRTGSMSAVLTAATLNAIPPPTTVVLQDRGEHRDLSCGERHNTSTPLMQPPNPDAAEFVESDPADSMKELFTDRLFCAGHTVGADGSIIGIGGTRQLRLWTETYPEVTFNGLRGGGGTPFLVRWDWSITNPTWTRVSRRRCRATAT